ncbi:MAG: YraN family protein [Deltaproteobacteria bacterium]|nr:YraN family protein [Deltaproteobacteria bacterium]
MLNLRQQYGAQSESLAARLLKRRGYAILETNYRTPLGEIDIIARDRDTIVFVEVKARRSLGFGGPKWAVTPKKQRKISMVALYYLKTTRQSQAKARFDVVAIRSLTEPPQVEIIQNAFDLLYG